VGQLVRGDRCELLVVKSSQEFWRVRQLTQEGKCSRVGYREDQFMHTTDRNPHAAGGARDDALEPGGGGLHQAQEPDGVEPAPDREQQDGRSAAREQQPGAGVEGSRHERE
jgi:hypothetical protein